VSKGSILIDKQKSPKNYALSPKKASMSSLTILDKREKKKRKEEFSK